MIVASCHSGTPSSIAQGRPARVLQPALVRPERGLEAGIHFLGFRQGQQHVGKPILERGHPVADVAQLLGDQLRIAALRHNSVRS
jgi:hypothetical protein